MAKDFLLTQGLTPRGRTVHYAQLAGSAEPKFVIGYRTMYEGNTGLFNTDVNNNLIYTPAPFLAANGFWAYFIFPTAKAESQGSYYCLNSYDRAKFTFSFMQYAAHVPNGDFVKFLKKLLALPSAADYFPRLALQGGRIFYKNATTGALNQLESDSSTQALMDYFNPTLADVETQELTCSARMVHWATNDTDHRRVQVETAIEHFKANMIVYNTQLHLNGVPAKVCQVICDILHQGRGTYARIAAAIATGGDWEKAYSNLLLIGNTNYAERISTVKATITSLVNQGVFNKTYNAATNSFV